MDNSQIYMDKTEMSNTISNGTGLLPDVFTVYANSFDLSLLPNDTDIQINHESTKQISQQSTSIINSNFDYIPTTIYQEPTIKIEKTWNKQNKNELNTKNSVLLEQLRKQYQFYPSPISSPSHDILNINLPPSPAPSVDCNWMNFKIKQEFHILPPSPPESSGVPSPYSDIKSEPDTDPDTFININTIYEKSIKNLQNKKPQQDHQLLREYLQDTTFQKKHNLKPLALESLIGGLDISKDIEPVISLALEHAKRDAQEMCLTLKISSDPTQWTTTQVHAWIQSTVKQFHLPQLEDLEKKFTENGAALVCLTEEEFNQRLPEVGATIHAQLEIWKLACADNFLTIIAKDDEIPNNWCSELTTQNMDISDDEDEEIPTTNTTTQTIITSKPGRSGGSHIHLWQFLKELLSSPQIYGTAIRWLDRTEGVFKIEDSVRVAKLWGRRKNRPAMNYDKLSRSIRQYYKKGIMKKTERSQRLVYQFCHPYCI